MVISIDAADDNDDDDNDDGDDYAYQTSNAQRPCVHGQWCVTPDSWVKSRLSELLSAAQAGCF